MHLTGIPSNSYRTVRFLSFQEESLGAAQVQKMRHFTEYLFTIALSNVIVNEGHVWGVAKVRGTGCVTDVDDCVQIVASNASAIAFKYRRAHACIFWIYVRANACLHRLRQPFDLVPPTSIYIDFDNDVFFTAAELRIDALDCTHPKCNEPHKKFYPSFFHKTYSLRGNVNNVVSGVHSPSLSSSVRHLPSHSSL